MAPPTTSKTKVNKATDDKAKPTIQSSSHTLQETTAQATHPFSPISSKSPNKNDYSSPPKSVTKVKLSHVLRFCFPERETRLKNEKTEFQRRRGQEKKNLTEAQRQQLGLNLKDAVSKNDSDSSDSENGNSSSKKKKFKNFYEPQITTESAIGRLDCLAFYGPLGTFLNCDF